MGSTEKEDRVVVEGASASTSTAGNNDSLEEGLGLKGATAGGSSLTVEHVKKLQEELVKVVQDHLASLLGPSTQTRSEPIDGAMARLAVADNDRVRIECKLCFEEIREFCALVPCGHACLCYQCAKKIERRGCPFCREDIRSVLKIFLDSA